MRLIDWILGKAEEDREQEASAQSEPAPTTHVLERAPIVVVAPHALRRGSWVMFNGRIGILHNYEKDGSIEVHLTNEDGETTLRAKTTPDQVRLARISEIPAKRIFPGLPEDEKRQNLLRLGYLP